jgi:selenide,water dikinase
MAAASGVTLEIDAAAVPILEGALALASENRSGGLATNQTYFGGGVEAGGAVEPDLVTLLYDPQTSGGLLLAVAADRADALVEELKVAGETAAHVPSEWYKLMFVRPESRPAGSLAF